MPRIIFWNLAGGRAGYYDGEIGGVPTAPKPVLSDQSDTPLVSGYSQGTLKVFLDGAGFEDHEEAEIEETEEMNSDGDVTVKVMEKQKMDLLSTVHKAISHDAYKKLKVMDRAVLPGDCDEGRRQQIGAESAARGETGCCATML